MTEINAEDRIEQIVEKIKEFFLISSGRKAVIGISGGKDSTVVAALCAKALGSENVIGVMMPNGKQKDIDDSKRVCKLLGIRPMTINIAIPYNDILDQISTFSEQAEINLAPRLRMATLYAVAQSVSGGRVMNTSNACEAYVGWGTLYGDTVGDFAPIKHLTVSQIVEIGLALKLPEDLVKKTPADGLTKKSDEDNLGVTYAAIEKFMNGHGEDLTNEELQIIINRHKMSEFKRQIINIPGVLSI